MPEESELIDVAKTFPTLHIDLKYATADNITGRPIYQEALCLLHSDAATALAKAISIASLAGLKLVSTTLSTAAGAGPAVGCLPEPGIRGRRGDWLQSQPRYGHRRHPDG